MEARAERTTRVHCFSCGVRLPSPQGLAAVGIVGGSEASMAAQSTTGGRSRRHDRRCFGRLEQEDQRLKKHYGRWMDIVRSMELQSCILTKLTKPSVPVNLVGPQVSLPPRWVPTSRGSIHFFVRNKEALPCVRRYSWWVPTVRGHVFFAKYSGPSGGSQLSAGGIIIFRVIRRHFLAAAVDPAVSLSTYSPRPMEIVP